jgi:hypothetical protein
MKMIHQIGGVKKPKSLYTIGESESDSGTLITSLNGLNSIDDLYRIIDISIPNDDIIIDWGNSGVIYGGSTNSLTLNFQINDGPPIDFLTFSENSTINFNFSDNGSIIFKDNEGNEFKLFTKQLNE